jgi:hypothetical protein
LLAGVVTAQKHTGFLIPLFIAALLLWWAIAWSAARLVGRPSPGWRRRVLRFGLWAIALGLSGAVHAYWSQAARAQADAVASAVLAYKSRAGSFPASLEQVGLDEIRLRHDWMLGYAFADGRPSLFYAATFTMFDGYAYDFEQRRWEFVPD